MNHVAPIQVKVEALFSHLPAHHGWEHISRVQSNAEQAVASEPDLTEDQKAVVIVAALLHDADDPKVFPGSEDYANARRILVEVDFPADLQELVMNSIKLVSCSTQNWANAHVPHQRWMLIPRDADRLDAVGAQGVRRCLEYAGTSRAMFGPQTPLPLGKDEILPWATQERFEAYKAGAKSQSTLDHFFDKLLHLRCDDSGNPYLTGQGLIAMQEMLDILHPMLVEAAAQRKAAAAAAAV